MTDETDYVRRTCEAATPGPWRAGVCSPDLFANARAIALLGSTWREALAVIEAAEKCGEPTRGDYPDDRRGALAAALDDYHAAVRAHREA